MIHILRKRAMTVRGAMWGYGAYAASVYLSTFFDLVHIHPVDWWARIFPILFLPILYPIFLAFGESPDIVMKLSLLCYAMVLGGAVGGWFLGARFQK